jgi:hypothetical protein
VDLLPTYAHGSIGSDFDLDLHAIWRESSAIPTPPPCLTTDRASSGLASLDLAESAGYKAQGSSLVKCFFHPNREDPSGFEWTGPDPLSVSTQSEDIFRFMSVFFLQRKYIGWSFDSHGLTSLPGT